MKTKIEISGKILLNIIISNALVILIIHMLLLFEVLSISKVLNLFVILASTALMFISVFIYRKRFGSINIIAEQIVSAFQAVFSTVKELSMETNFLKKSVNSQNEAVHNCVSSIEETSQMAAQTTQQSQESVNFLKEVKSKSDKSAEIMKELGHSVENIAKVNKSLDEMNKLIEIINEKTNIINEIVFNTRLLSFNASVEAERAGEHGRGFSVVAQEIGNLANMSGKASLEIQEVLSQTKKQISTIIDETKKTIIQGQNITGQALDSFKDINEKIDQIRNRIDGISEATREQQIGIEQASRSMTKLEDGANANFKVVSSSERLTGSLTDNISACSEAINYLLMNNENNANQQLEFSHDFITWSSDLFINLDSIDNQHKKLVELINKLYYAIRHDADKQSLRVIFSELLDYTKNHFSYEERLFSQYGYSENSDHKKKHVDLVTQLKKLFDDFNNGLATVDREVMEFLKKWLTDHILGDDRAYVPFLKSKGVK